MPKASFTELAITGVAIQTGIFATGVQITGVTIQSGQFYTGFELRLGPTFRFGGSIAEGIDTNVAKIQQELQFNMMPTLWSNQGHLFEIMHSVKTTENITRGSLMPALERIAASTEGMLSHLQTGTTNVRVEQPLTINISGESQAGIGARVGSAVLDANRGIIDTIRDAIRTNEQGLRSDIQRLNEDLVAARAGAA